MSASCYYVSLWEIRTCKGNDCLSLTCMHNNGDHDMNDGLSFQIVSTKFRYRFIPLSNRPVYIFYDLEQDIVRIRP